MSGRDEEILRSLASRIDPDDAGAHNNLGVVFYQKGLTADAIQAFERALELDPRMEEARSNVEIAYRESGQFERRVEELRARIRSDPDDLDARDTLARTYLLAGYPDDAAHEWTTLLEERPDNAALHMKLAHAETERGNGARALELVEHALTLEPELSRLHLQHAELMYHTGDREAAETAVRRALALNPESPRGFLLLAHLLEAGGQTDEAEQARRAAEQLDPGLAPGERHLSLRRYRTATRSGSGDREPAEEPVEGPVLEPPAETDARDPATGPAQEGAEPAGEPGSDPGASAGDEEPAPAGEPEPGAEETEPVDGSVAGEGPSPEREPALARDPEDELARASAPPEAVEGALSRLARATALRQEGALEAAGEELAKALVEENSFEIRQALAEVRLLQGDADRAASLYGKLLEEEQESPKLWNERGVALHRLGRLEEAVDAYRHAVALDYGYALGWNNLGVSRAQLGEGGSGERALRKAAEDSPQPEILWNLGLFLNLHGEVDEAIQVYAQAVRADKSVAESWNRLGGVLFQATRLQEARKALDRALELDPELPEARYQLGFVLSALGDFNGALRETKQALAQEAVFPPPRYRLLLDVQFEGGSIPAPAADVPERVATGQPIETFVFDGGALDHAFSDFAEPDEPDPGEVAAALEVAERAMSLGKLQEAMDRAARAVALAPEAPVPRLFQARLYLTQGLAGEALERYTEVLQRGAEEHAGEAAEGRVRSLLMLERASEAVPMAKAAVKLGAEPSLLGRTLLEAGDAESAIRVFEADAAADRSPDTMRWYAEALRRVGRLAEAEPLFRHVLSRSPSAAARVGLARTLKALGDREGAEAAYLQAVRQLPSYAPAALGLAELRWWSGRQKEALRTLVGFLELDPNHVDGLVRLGAWLHETGRTEQGARVLQRACRLDPHHTRAAEELARVHGVD